MTSANFAYVWYLYDVLPTELWSYTLGPRPISWVYIFPRRVKWCGVKKNELFHIYFTSKQGKTEIGLYLDSEKSVISRFKKRGRHVQYSFLWERHREWWISWWYGLMVQLWSEENTVVVMVDIEILLCPAALTGLNELARLIISSSVAELVTVEVIRIARLGPILVKYWQNFLVIIMWL